MLVHGVVCSEDARGLGWGLAQTVPVLSDLIINLSLTDQCLDLSFALKTS